MVSSIIIDVTGREVCAGCKIGVDQLKLLPRCPFHNCLLGRASIFRASSLRARVIDAIIKRDGMDCRLCGLPLECREAGTIDHIMPKSKGGKDWLHNLQLAHGRCNAEKADMTMEQWTEYRARQAADRNVPPPPV